jgi:hypothetical protein
MMVQHATNNMAHHMPTTLDRSMKCFGIGGGLPGYLDGGIGYIRYGFTGFVTVADLAPMSVVRFSAT